MKILWNYFRMIELSITDSAKKKLVKTDILGLRYKQFSGGGVKKIFFQKRKKHDFFNFWNLDVSKMDWNNGFNSSFFVGFPNNPNLDVSGHFGCKFFFWWLPLSAKVVSIYRLTGSRELRHFARSLLIKLPFPYDLWWCPYFPSTYNVGAISLIGKSSRRFVSSSEDYIITQYWL